MGRCVVCPFTVYSTGSICVSDPRRVTTRTDAAVTLQLYVTVVPCSQTGWIETTGLKKSLDIVTEEGLAWFVVPQPPRHCRPCCCFWCCSCCCCWWWWWWWWWSWRRSQSCRWCCCCGRLRCRSILWLLSASSAMTHVLSLLCSHRHDCNGGYWWWWWWSLVYIYI